MRPPHPLLNYALVEFDRCRAEGLCPSDAAVEAARNVNMIRPKPTETYSKGGPWTVCDDCHGTGRANKESADEECMTLAEYVVEFGDVCRGCEGGGWTWPLGSTVLSCSNTNLDECLLCEDGERCDIHKAELDFYLRMGKLSHDGNNQTPPAPDVPQMRAQVDAEAQESDHLPGVQEQAVAGEESKELT